MSRASGVGVIPYMGVWNRKNGLYAAVWVKYIYSMSRVDPEDVMTVAISGLDRG